MSLSASGRPEATLAAVHLGGSRLEDAYVESSPSLGEHGERGDAYGRL